MKTLKIDTAHIRQQVVVASALEEEINLGHLREIVKQSEALNDDATVSFAGIEEHDTYKGEVVAAHVLVRDTVDL